MCVYTLKIVEFNVNDLSATKNLIFSSKKKKNSNQNNINPKQIRNLEPNDVVFVVHLKFAPKLIKDVASIFACLYLFFALFSFFLSFFRRKAL